MKFLVTVFLAAVVLVAGPAFAKPVQPSAHHDITVEIDPATWMVSISDTIRVEDRDRLQLWMDDWLKIEAVEVDGKPVDAMRSVKWTNVPVSGMGPWTIDLRMTGAVPEMPPPSAGRGFRGSAGAGDGGAYLFGSSGFLPSTFDEAISYRLTVKVPEPYRAVAPGKLTDEATSDGIYSATFVSDMAFGPPSLFAGPYKVAEQVADGIRLRTYFHEDIAGFSDQYLETSAGYLKRYSDEIGDYPFADFHIISSPLPVGLGFPNLTYIGRMIVPLPFMKGRSLAHEVVHNWWGNGVEVAYSEGNWAEGLTTYMADFGLAEAEGAGAARQMRLSWLRDYAALPAERDGPVTAFVTKQHDASQIIGYNKVAYIFHMLKEEIGEEAFSKGIRDFWTKHRFAIAGWSDLQATFEMASGRHLDWFFDQWLDRTGAPEIALAGAETEGEAGNYLTTVSLEQSGDVYKLLVPIEIETTSGTHREAVRFEEAEETFALRTGDKPVMVRIDPSFDVFRRLIPGEQPPILRDVTLAPVLTSIVLSDDEGFATAAAALVRRLSGKGTRIVTSTEPAGADGPVIVAGAREDLRRFAENNLTGPVPDRTDGSTAAVWVDRTTSGDPVMLIAAESTEALAALSRPLPHYGRQSYVVFSGRKAIDRGVWPSESGPLTKVLSE